MAITLEISTKRNVLTPSSGLFKRVHVAHRPQTSGRSLAGALLQADFGGCFICFRDLRRRQSIVSKRAGRFYKSKRSRNWLTINPDFVRTREDFDPGDDPHERSAFRVALGWPLQKPAPSSPFGSFGVKQIVLSASNWISRRIDGTMKPSMIFLAVCFALAPFTARATVPHYHALHPARQMQRHAIPVTTTALVPAVKLDDDSDGLTRNREECNRGCIDD